MGLNDKELSELSIQMTEVYSDEDIELRLSNLPRLHYAQGLVMYDDYEVMLLAKQSLEVEKAKAHLRARNNDLLTSEADRKAWASTQEDVMGAELSYISAQKDWKLAELKWNAIDSLFVAVRKLASIREKGLQDQARDNQGRQV